MLTWLKELDPLFKFLAMIAAAVIYTASTFATYAYVDNKHTEAIRAIDSVRTDVRDGFREMGRDVKQILRSMPRE